MNITIEIVTKISSIKSVWDNLLPNQHHLRATHLAAFEQATINDVDIYYVKIFLKQKLIGVAYIQCFWFKHSHLNFSNQNGFKTKAIKFLLPKQLPILVCGNLFRIGFQGFYFTNEIHNSLIFDALEIFSKQVKKTCVIGIKDCSEIFIEKNYIQHHYHFFNGDVTMEIARKLHWLSFDDYLKNLSKKYLKRAKKIIDAFKDIEQKEFNADEIIENTVAIEKLYWNIVNKQTVKMGTVNASYFYHLKNDLGNNFEFHALYHSKEMVGFYTYIFYEKEMETHYIGLNYDYNNSHKLYFNILFLSLQKLIQRNFNKLELGRTAKEAKTNLGAHPKQIFNYIKVKSVFAKIALKYFLRKFNNTENNKQLERSPFYEKTSG